MNLLKAIAELHEEKNKLDRVIAVLEGFDSHESGQPTARRRGRKSMSAEERSEVSARLKRYWAQKRQAG
jgi:DNA invertase Pin-like site-specific DNA recombinase